MKCIKNLQTNHIRRVRNHIAEEHVATGLYQYINKQAFKDQNKKIATLKTMRNSK